MLNATIDRTFPTASGKPQAAVLQLDYRGQLLTQFSLGDRDPKAKSGPPDTKTIFRIGSVTKIFPVLMLYQLYDRGIVSSLDDPLSKYAPGFDMPNVHSRSKRRYTLRQLASQLSGLPRELPCLLWNCSDLTTPIALERYRQNPVAIFAEYTEPSYSNAAYALLGNILAEYTNTTFSEYVRVHILDPLGMHDTGFTFTPEVEARMAKNYVNETLTPNVDIGYAAPAGQMYSTIEDLMTLGRYFTGVAGELFDDGFRKELLMPGFVWRDGAFLQGQPWETQLVAGNWLLLAKGGNIWGYSAVIGMIPPLNLTVAVAWSGGTDETSFVGEAFDKVVPEFVQALVTVRPALPLPKDPSRYVGNYTAAMPVLGATSAVSINVRLANLPDGHVALLMTGMFSGFLAFQDDNRAYLSDAGYDGHPNCFVVMASAALQTWVIFETAADGNVHSIELPGMTWGIKFQKLDVESVAGKEEVLTFV